MKYFPVASHLRPMVSVFSGSCLVALAFHPTHAHAAKPPPASKQPASAIAPLLKRYCFECHGKGQKEGGLALDGILNFQDAKPDTWEAIHEQIQLGHMPPKDGDQPTSDEREKMVSWIFTSMRATGHHINNKLEWPNYGNFVPHEPLFRGPAHTSPATHVRMWRQRPGTYASRNGGGTQAFSMLPGQQVADFSSLYSVDESSAEIILRNAEQLVKAWTPAPSDAAKNGTPKIKPLDPAFLELLKPQPAAYGDALRKSLQCVFQWAMNRPAREEEVEKISQLHERVLAKHGHIQAARAALMVPLLEPEAIYRLELGEGPLDEHGRRRLSKTELLNAIQHTLYTGMDSPAILKAARADNRNLFDSRERVADLVKTLLQTDAANGSPNERLLGFFDEFFDYRKAKDVFKDIPGGLNFVPDAFIRDTQRLIQMIVREDKNVFFELLTTTKTFAAGASVFGGSTIRLYNLPPDWRKTETPVEMDSVQRAGILTQPSWLVAHSGNFDNDPVRRGKWVLEHLLGGTVPDVPVTVCANVPRDETKTLRVRFEVVSKDSYCWKCHERMNQLGMPFEVFDHFGRYRLLELNKPADGAGAVVASGDPALDGEVADALELIRRLAPSKRVQEVFIRYAFRYFMGRNETLRDAQTLRDANQAYGESGGSMQALVASLLSSDSFLFRSLQM